MRRAKHIDRWRNPIVTLLIERPEMTRRAIHRALYGRANPKNESDVDKALTNMVRAGDLYRPRKGVYCIRRPT